MDRAFCEGRFSLRFALKEGDGWSAPRVITEGANWFVNWADFPSMVALPDCSLAAHWLVKSGSETFDYDVTISRSFDGGKTWGKPFVPHRGRVKDEHGFVSMFAANDGSLAAVWLDGHEMKNSRVRCFQAAIGWLALSRASLNFSAKGRRIWQRETRDRPRIVPRTASAAMQTIKEVFTADRRNAYRRKF